MENDIVGIAMGMVRLRNGLLMPAIGLGPMIMNYGKVREGGCPSRWNLPCRVWRKVKRCRDYAQFVKAISSGIQLGFRLVDYATAYGNLRAIGDAIMDSDVDRKDCFLTARISNRAQFGGKDAIMRELDAILDAYQTDYLDLLMFHFPVTDCYINTWDVFVELYGKGVCRSVGVANCHKHHLATLESSGFVPMYNQIEVHPLFTNMPLLGYCAERGIVVESYTPLARMDDRLYRLPSLQAIACKHNKTTAQIVLRWHVQQGLVPCVRALDKKHQQESLDIFDFFLSKEEMAMISGFNINSRLRFDPDNCDFTIL